jgi:adenylyltransferase/sulfurtransferase
MILPELGAAGQRRLAAARVLLVGVGGLGSPAALYLSAAGVGTLGLVDFDAVDETNLQRQIIYGTADIGVPKLQAAAARLRAQNPGVALELHEAPFGAANARRLVDAYDLIVDGTDNFATRYLVNDACVMAGKPNVYGSVSRFEGQVSVFAKLPGPCYRCLHPEPPPDGLIPSCAEAGVLGVLPGIIGTLQATEAIKLITGMGEPLVGRLLLYDALRMRFREIGLPRDTDCPVCGDAPTIRELVEYDLTCVAASPRSPTSPTSPTSPKSPKSPTSPTSPTSSTGQRSTMTVSEFQKLRAEGHPHALIDVREVSEHEASRIEGGLLIPLGTLSQRLDLLPDDRPVIVYCHSGGRSARATAMLRAQGFDAHNLEGGILAWHRATGG